MDNIKHLRIINVRASFKINMYVNFKHFQYILYKQSFSMRIDAVNNGHMRIDNLLNNFCFDIHNVWLHAYNIYYEKHLQIE